MYLLCPLYRRAILVLDLRSRHIYSVEAEQGVHTGDHVLFRDSLQALAPAKWPRISWYVGKGAHGHVGVEAGCGHGSCGG